MSSLQWGYTNSDQSHHVNTHPSSQQAELTKNSTEADFMELIRSYDIERFKEAPNKHH